MPDLKPGSVIVCLGCSRCVPLASWQRHRETCWRLAEQLALSEDLEPAVFAIELDTDIKHGGGAVVVPPEVQCTKCGSGPGELCVNREGGAMRRIHAIRAELQAEYEASRHEAATN